MRIILYFVLLSLVINITLSKKFRNKNHLGKANNKKNNTLHTLLVTTELNKEEIERILNKNGTVTCNRTLVSEVIDNKDFQDDIDIEIEDEIIDNGTTPHLTDFLEKETKTVKSQSFLEKNNEHIIKKEKFGKILPLMSLIIFVFALIHFNKIKINKKVIKTYKIYDFDFKEENLIIKNK